VARVQIPVTDFVRAGVSPPAQTDGDAVNKHYIAGNDGQIVIEVASSDAGAQTVTVKANPDLDTDGLIVSDLVLSVPAGQTKWFGPFKVQTFKQNTNKDMYLDPSVSTTLKFRAYRLVRA